MEFDPRRRIAKDDALAGLPGPEGERFRELFRHGSLREPFGPGDFLFAPAGVSHRFEDFTRDLVVWVLFYGPEGGEAPRE
jgi:hypothetical protein